MNFYEVSILFAVSGVLGVIARILKQPLIVGYLLAGIFLSLFGIIKDSVSIASMGQIGVTLLLFLLGLEMRLTELPSIGRVSLTTAIIQIAATSILGLLILPLLGFGMVSSLYIAIALSFSSTIIVVKLLSEKKDLASLYARIVVGFLLVQDFVAILLLVVLTSVDKSGLSFLGLGTVLLKMAFLALVLFLFYKKVLPFVFERFVSASHELLFIASIAWVMAFSSFVARQLGFNLEIGGFLAGIALSGLPEHLQIAAKTKPLRDFFMILFFVYLGTKLAGFPLILGTLFPILVVVLFVLVVKPLILLILMGIMGYKKRTSFMAALSIAQVSEFSLIVMALGVNLGHIRSDEAAFVIFIAVVTMTLSTYLVQGSERIYRRASRLLSIFEKKRTKEYALSPSQKVEDHFVLVGCDRTGRVLLPLFSRLQTPLLVVDFNPSVFTRLTAEGVSCVFGDITDEEVVELANLRQARLVISTIPSLEDSLILLQFLNSLEKKPRNIFIATNKKEAILLYENGADLVVVPDMVAGDYIKHIIRLYRKKPDKLVKAGRLHFNRLMYV